MGDSTRLISNLYIRFITGLGRIGLATMQLLGITLFAVSVLSAEETPLGAPDSTSHDAEMSHLTVDKHNIAILNTTNFEEVNTGYDAILVNFYNSQTKEMDEFNQAADKIDITSNTVMFGKFDMDQDNAASILSEFNITEPGLRWLYSWGPEDSAAKYEGDGKESDITAAVNKLALHIENAHRHEHLDEEQPKDGGIHEEL